MVFSQIFTSCRPWSKKNQKSWQRFPKKTFVFGYENKLKYTIYKSKICCEKNMLIYYWKEKKAKCNILLSKILVQLCVIINYIMEGNIFVIIGYKLLVQKKYYNVISKIALKLMINKWLGCLKKVNTLNSVILKEKYSHHL